MSDLERQMTAALERLSAGTQRNSRGTPNRSKPCGRDRLGREGDFAARIDSQELTCKAMLA